MDSMITKEKLVVYYWTNLALNEQGQGLDQQKNDFNLWLAQNPGDVAADFTDTYIQRTKPKHFPELAKAVDFCMHNNAKLVVVKLGGLLSQKQFANLLATKGLDFVCLDDNLVTPEVLPLVRKYIEAQRKKHGNSIKRGLLLTSNKLGNPNAAKAISPFNQIKTENAVMFALLLQPIIVKLQKQGLSQRKMVSALNDAGIVAPEGGKWVLSQLQKVLKRIDTNNLAIKLKDEINDKQLGSYSASDLVSALNTTNFKPHNSQTWNEETLEAVQNRDKVINNVLEIYDFIQSHGNLLNQLISEGKTLTDIAGQLSDNAIPVPKALAEENNTSWNDKLVEEVIKRMNNSLSLPYDSVVLKDFCAALEDYAHSETSSSAKQVYGHRALTNMFADPQDSNYVPGRS